MLLLKGRLKELGACVLSLSDKLAIFCWTRRVSPYVHTLSRHIKTKIHFLKINKQTSTAETDDTIFMFNRHIGSMSDRGLEHNALLVKLTAVYGLNN
jgi:hypothetical protein